MRPRKEVAPVWKRHWRLTGDPFLGPGAPYVRDVGPRRGRRPAGGLDRDRASGSPCSARGRAGQVDRPGAGGRRDEGAAPAVRPGRRRRSTGRAMLAGLAAGLGVRSRRARAGRPPGRPWPTPCRLCRWQKIQAVLVVDDCQDLTDPADRRDLERLTHLDPNPAARLTVVQSFREPDDDDGRTTRPRLATRDPPAAA